VRRKQTRGKPAWLTHKEKDRAKKESGIGLAGSFFFDEIFIREGVFNKEFVITTYGSC
jgi:hypothetical protein